MKNTVSESGDPLEALVGTGLSMLDVIVLIAIALGAVYGRIGTTTQPFGTTASWLVDVVNVLTGNLDSPGGAMFPHAAHERPRRPPRAFRTGRASPALVEPLLAQALPLIAQLPEGGLRDQILQDLASQGRADLDDLRKRAHPLLASLPGFVGNVEGRDLMATEPDVVVIGSGSSGGVLASRLREDPGCQAVADALNLADLTCQAGLEERVKRSRGNQAPVDNPRVGLDARAAKVGLERRGLVDGGRLRQRDDDDLREGRIPKPRQHDTELGKSDSPKCPVDFVYC